MVWREARRSAKMRTVYFFFQLFLVNSKDSGTGCPMSSLVLLWNLCLKIFRARATVRLSTHMLKSASKIEQQLNSRVYAVLICLGVFAMIFAEGPAWSWCNLGQKCWTLPEMENKAQTPYFLSDLFMFLAMFTEYSQLRYVLSLK